MCDLSKVIHPLPNKCSPPGMYSFRFKVKVPDWLTASTFYFSRGEEKLNAQISYTLVAEFIPDYSTDLAATELCHFRAVKGIKIFHPKLQVPTVN